MDMTHWKRHWCWERLKARGEGEDRGWGGWMASPTRWTWVWGNFGSWWWTGRPGLLQSMGSQRVTTEGLNWTEPIWSTTAFWILAKPLHLRSMLSRTIRYSWNCSAYSWHWSTEKGLILLHDNSWPHVVQPVLQNLNKLNCEVLSHLPYSPDISPMDFHFFTHLDNFLQGKCVHNQQDSENAFQEFIKSESTDFYTSGINKLISHWQKYVDCNGSYFDIFEPSYNNLKFMVWNCNYPLQYSCLENPVDRGAWWAAVHRVSQSQTQLKRLSMHECIGEGNDNPLKYSCLENPRDRGAWWAAIYGGRTKSDTTEVT